MDRYYFALRYTGIRMPKQTRRATCHDLFFPFRRQATLWKDSIQSPLGVFGFGDLFAFALFFLFFTHLLKTFAKAVTGRAALLK